MNLSFSPAAAEDISAIWDYTAETWGMDRADSYIDAIRDACLSLAAGTALGRRVDVRAGYLKCPVGRHLIYYRETTTDLEVIRILHQRMDTERYL
jgi:toxin ParE1/3/4